MVCRVAITKDETKFTVTNFHCSGVDAGDVLNVLGTIAPYIMSGLSAATESAQTQQQAQAAPAGGFDLGGLMSMFGAQPQQEPEPAPAPSVDGSQLLSALLSMMK